MFRNLIGLFCLNVPYHSSWTIGWVARPGTVFVSSGSSVSSLIIYLHNSLFFSLELLYRFITVTRSIWGLILFPLLKKSDWLHTDLGGFHSHLHNHNHPSTDSSQNSSEFSGSLDFIIGVCFFFSINLLRCFVLSFENYLSCSTSAAVNL